MLHRRSRPEAGWSPLDSPIADGAVQEINDLCYIAGAVLDVMFCVCLASVCGGCCAAL